MNKVLNETPDCVAEYFKLLTVSLNTSETGRLCFLFTHTSSIRSDVLNYHQTIHDIKTDDWEDHTHVLANQNSLNLITNIL